MPFIPERLKSARLFQGWSLQELADKVGVSKQILSRWETGQGTPNMQMQERLAVALEKPANWFSHVPPKVVITNLVWHVCKYR